MIFHLKPQKATILHQSYQSSKAHWYPGACSSRGWSQRSHTIHPQGIKSPSIHIIISILDDSPKSNPPKNASCSISQQKSKGLAGTYYHLWMGLRVTGPGPCKVATGSPCPAALAIRSCWEASARAARGRPLPMAGQVVPTDPWRRYQASKVAEQPPKLMVEKYGKVGILEVMGKNIIFNIPGKKCSNMF